MHPQNEQDQAAGADPWEIIRRQERYIEGLENGLGAKVRDVTHRLVESGLSWNEASSRVAALTAAMPTMPTADTAWGWVDDNTWCNLVGGQPTTDRVRLTTEAEARAAVALDPGARVLIRAEAPGIATWEVTL